jgi:hypothetical protein
MGTESPAGSPSRVAAAVSSSRPGSRSPEPREAVKVVLSLSIVSKGAVPAVAPVNVAVPGSAATPWSAWKA